MSEFITFKRWAPRDGREEAELVELVREEIVPHFKKLPGCPGLGLLRILGARSYLVPSQLNYEKDIVGAVCHEHPGWKSASRWRHEPYCVPLRAHGHVASGQSHPGHAVADNYG